MKNYKAPVVLCRSFC